MYNLPVFTTAFRVFFLMSALEAVAIITMWLIKLHGVHVVTTQLGGTDWHSYEMVFGFVRAAIFGFVFTAGQHWTGKFLLGGKSAFILFILWLLGRFAFYLPEPYALISFGFDAAASIFAIYRLLPLLKQKNNRPPFYLITLMQLALFAAIATHYVGTWQEYYFHAVRTGLLMTVLLVAIIAGRILPFFAGVVMAGDKPKIRPGLEKWIWPATQITIVAFIASEFHNIASYIAAGIFFIYGVLHAVRWYNWRPFASFKFPILVILFAGYFWLFIGFFFMPLYLSKVFASLPTDAAYRSAAWHVFGIGAAGVFIFGMITRVALGHTGRPIKASPSISFAYLTLNLALLARVIIPLIGITYANTGYLVAGSLWLITFVLYLVKYTPMLVRPRIDGRPG
ncbi:MAG: hypothetical protein LDLANPLL_00275 [Turneriella sp.]|nr:hypothetical protein [Turneriella sp.]